MWGAQLWVEGLLYRNRAEPGHLREVLNAIKQAGQHHLGEVHLCHTHNCSVRMIQNGSTVD